MIEFRYDPEGNRVRKDVTVGAQTTTTNYLVDAHQAFAQVLMELNGAGQITAKYTYGDDLLKVSRGGEYYYFYDGLGSTRLMTDVTGSAVNFYVYDAYGKFFDNEIAATVPNEYLFTGERVDSETGLAYLRARYYDSTTGRFISFDAFTGIKYEPLSLHRYLYTHGNPVNNTDFGGQFIGGLIEMSVTSAIDSMRRGEYGVAAFKVYNLASATANAGIGTGYLLIGAFDPDLEMGDRLKYFGLAAAHYTASVADLLGNHPVFWGGSGFGSSGFALATNSGPLVALKALAESGAAGGIIANSIKNA